MPYYVVYVHGGVVEGHKMRWWSWWCSGGGWSWWCYAMSWDGRVVQGVVCGMVLPTVRFWWRIWELFWEIIYHPFWSHSETMFWILCIILESGGPHERMLRNGDILPLFLSWIRLDLQYSGMVCSAMGWLEVSHLPVSWHISCIVCLLPVSAIWSDLVAMAL